MQPMTEPMNLTETAQWANRRAAPDRPAKRTAKWAIAEYSRVTAAARVLPDYLIIGAQRCGTTSLQKYLGRHPLAAPARFTKGTHFFDREYPRGAGWYRSHFPTVTEQALKRMRHHGAAPLAGESSSYYIFHPLALERIAETMPTARLVVMLRDPVSRAWSHYNHEAARGFEDLPFAAALEREPERLAGEAERMAADPAYDSFSWRHHSYFTRGLYLEQLHRLYALFPQDQVLLLESGELFADPDATYGRVLEFLGLPGLHLDMYEQRYSYKYERLDPGLRAELAERYAEPNRLLFDQLGNKFEWAAP
jgi:hypothetical protein